MTVRAFKETGRRTAAHGWRYGTASRRPPHGLASRRNGVREKKSKFGDSMPSLCVVRESLRKVRHDRSVEIESKERENTMIRVRRRVCVCVCVCVFVCPLADVGVVALMIRGRADR